MNDKYEVSEKVGKIGRRIITARDKGHGVRLSWKECWLLAHDMENSECVAEYEYSR